jgi:uncharacterized protein (TIGR03083 family)
MNCQAAWTLIHQERTSLADTLESLDVEQWSTKSWSKGWSVKQTAAHLVGAAEQTFMNFCRELIAAGFKFNTFTERGVERIAQAGPDELVRRLRARTTTTNRPPAPTMAMLGEIVVHGDDIRRPLGLVHRSPDAALVAIANSWKNSNILIGAKRRIAGLTLTSTDVPWSHGAGPEVSGPLQSLVLAMTGRQGSHQDPDNDGLEILALRNRRVRASGSSNNYEFSATKSVIPTEVRTLTSWWY